MNDKTPLFGKTLSDLEALVAEYKLPKFGAKQIADWLYCKNISSIDEMTNLSKKAREILNANHTFGLIDPVETKVSTDGTKKYLFPAGNGKYIQAAVKELAPTLADIVLAEKTAPQITPIEGTDAKPEYSVLHTSTWGPVTTIVISVAVAAVIVYAIGELDGGNSSSESVVNNGDHYTAGGDINVGNDSSRDGE